MRGLRTGRVAAFLLLTSALSWGFHVLVSATIGSDAYLELGLSPTDVLFPAFVALILRLFFLKDGPVHVGCYHGKPRWMLYGFLMLTVMVTALTLALLLVWNESFILQALGSLLTTLWTLPVFFVAAQSSREELRRAGLQLGDTDWAVRLVLGAVLFLVLQARLNLMPGLGAFQGPADLRRRRAASPVPPGVDRRLCAAADGYPPQRPRGGV